MPFGLEGTDDLGDESTFSRPDSAKRLTFFAEVMPKGFTVFRMHRSQGEERGGDSKELAEFHNIAQVWFCCPLNEI